MGNRNRNRMSFVVFRSNRLTLLNHQIRHANTDRDRNEWLLDQVDDFLGEGAVAGNYHRFAIAGLDIATGSKRYKATAGFGEDRPWGCNIPWSLFNVVCIVVMHDGGKSCGPVEQSHGDPRVGRERGYQLCPFPRS